MGYYINHTSKGAIDASYASKCAALEADGAEKVNEPSEWREGLVCCMNNGMFGAAGYAYSEQEMNVFKRGYGERTHQWYLYPSAKQFAC
jgi:hypothetical protein